MKSKIQEHPKNNFKIVSKNLIIAAALVFSISSFAQDQTKPERKGNRVQKEKMSPEQRNQAALDKMTSELKLDANQQEQIKPLLAEQNAKMEAMRAERMNGNAKEMSSQERDAFRTKRQEDKKASDAKLKAILTPEQFKKMKANEDANRERMREGRGNGNGNWGGNRDNGGDNGGGNMGGDN